jgi:hypothetical protein
MSDPTTGSAAAVKVAGINARAKCRHCRERILLTDGAVRELASRLRFRLTCPKCGAMSEVSVLGRVRSAPGPAPTPRPEPVTVLGQATPAAPPPVLQPASAPPFRPLIVPTAAEPTPLVTSAAVQAPFAPLEGAYGGGLMAGLTPPAPRGRWSRLRPGTQKLIVLLGLVAAGGLAVAVKIAQRPKPPAPAEAAPEPTPRPAAAAPAPEPPPSGRNPFRPDSAPR